MLIASVHSTLNWCRSPLTFTDGTPMSNQTHAAPVVKPRQTVPGHFVRPKSTSGTEEGGNGVGRGQATRNGTKGADERYDPKFYSRTRRKLEDEMTRKQMLKERAKEKKSSHNEAEEATGLTALVSFPGSGNTWLRYLIQQATGEKSTSCVSVKSFRLVGRLVGVGRAG